MFYTRVSSWDYGTNNSFYEKRRIYVCIYYTKYVIFSYETCDSYTDFFELSPSNIYIFMRCTLFKTIYLILRGNGSFS